MRKNLFVIVLLLITSMSFAQNTKRLKENAGYGKAKFYVLQSDEKTKHGEFKITSYTPPFRNLVLGNYSNGKRDGLWTEKYDQAGNQVRIKGSYDKGEKIGEWKYFDSEGNLIQVFDYDKGALTMNSECGEKTSFTVEVSGDLKTRELTCPPTRIGGLKIFTKDLYREIYKVTPFEINSPGRTNISIDENLSFFISPEGAIEEIKYSGAQKNEQLDKVIKNYLSANKDGWISGEIDGEKVKAQLNIPIRIRMMF